MKNQWEKHQNNKQATKQNIEILVNAHAGISAIDHRRPKLGGAMGKDVDVNWLP